MLIVRAMWELLQQHTELTEVDLGKKVRELDLSDGRLDARIQTDAAPAQCPGCENEVHPTQISCHHAINEEEGYRVGGHVSTPPWIARWLGSP